MAKTELVRNTKLALLELSSAVILLEQACETFDVTDNAALGDCEQLCQKAMQHAMKTSAAITDLEKHVDSWNSTGFVKRLKNLKNIAKNKTRLTAARKEAADFVAEAKAAYQKTSKDLTSANQMLKAIKGLGG